jgi:hypothetical protein
MEMAIKGEFKDEKLGMKLFSFTLALIQKCGSGLI